MSPLDKKNKKSNNHFVRQPYAVMWPEINLAEGEVRLVDTHVHTNYSDGTAEVRDVEEACLSMDIGCCITDHNEIRGAVKLLERDRVPTVPAIEVGSREKIELLVFFQTAWECEEYYRKHIEPFRLRRFYTFLPRSLDYLIAAISDYNTLVSIPHPFAPLWKNIQYGRKRRDTVNRALAAADCIEVLNGGLPKRANRRALRLCEQLGCLPLGGSDSHDIDSIGSVVVAFRTAVTSASLFEAMSNGRMMAILGQDSRPRYLSNFWHMAKRHSRKFVLMSG